MQFLQDQLPKSAYLKKWTKSLNAMTNLPKREDVSVKPLCYRCRMS